jgi:hypothetical protein
MTEYTAQCRASRYDRITAQVYGDAVELAAHFSDEYAGETWLNPDAARTFARGILALADEIDGGEGDTPTLKIGDKVEVVADNFASLIGKRGTLVDIVSRDTMYPYRFRAEGRSSGDVWVQEVRKVDEPAGLLDEAGLADGERDLNESAAAAAEPTPSPFARYVDEAKQLLEGTSFTATDVIVLARELHESA